MNVQAGVGLRSSSMVSGISSGAVHRNARPGLAVFPAHVGNNPHPGARFRNHGHQIAENFRESGTSVVAHRLP